MTDTKENTNTTDVIKEIHHLFSKDRFSHAVERLKVLGDDFDCNDGTSKNVERISNNSNNFHHTDVVLKKTKEFQKEMCDLINSVAPNTLNGGGWKVICDEEGKDNVFYRNENEEKPGGKMSFRVEGFVEASLLNIACLIYELDLWPKWFPGMIKARTHATLSKFRLVPVLESWLPWFVFLLFITPTSESRIS